MTTEQRGAPLDPDELVCPEHGRLYVDEFWIDGEGLYWCWFCRERTADEERE